MDKKITKKTNATPYIIAGYCVIILTFGVVGVWAAMAKLDKAIVASGQIEVEDDRRQIQHLEGGIIKETHVEEGQLVSKGDVLIELNDVQATADLQVVNLRLLIAEAIGARLQAERNLSDKISFPSALLDDTNAEVVKTIDEQRIIFQGRRSLLKSQEDVLTNKIDQLKREKQGIREQKRAFKERAEILLERLNRVEKGLETGAIRKNVVSSYDEEHVEMISNVARMATEEAKIDKAISETRLNILQTRQEFQERASNDYKEIFARIQELHEQHKVVLDVLNRSKIRAPINGVAQNLKLNGYVIQGGQTLLEIIPRTDEMIINARIMPLDIDNVVAGQVAEIKFSSFPSSLMPIITGTVQTVSRGSIIPENPQESPYYLARIKVDKKSLPTNIRNRLSAGMPAEVLVSSGERTLIDYIVSPLSNAIWKSMGEE